VTTTHQVPTDHGPARLHVDAALGRPRALVVLGHGAGGGVAARDLAALAVGLPSHGITVVRVEQPWRVAGRRIAPAPALLDAAWLPAVRAAVSAVPGVPLVVGGRSAGARVACRCAAATAAAGVLALGFPLHPSGRPERSRAGELAVRVPLLVVQGERDAFGRPEEFAGVEVVAITAADHGFAVPRRGPLTHGEVDSLLVAAVVNWMSPWARRRSGRESATRALALPPA